MFFFQNIIGFSMLFGKTRWVFLYSFAKQDGFSYFLLHKGVVFFYSFRHTERKSMAKRYVYGNRTQISDSGAAGRSVGLSLPPHRTGLSVHRACGTYPQTG